jgi:hypothetical protein
MLRRSAPPARRGFAPAALAIATLAAIATALAPSRALAQLVTSSPGAYATLSVGYQDLPDIHEGGSDSDWRIGGFPIFRGSIEMPVNRGSQLGAVVSYARMPMTYYGADCNGCNADATLWQALGMFRMGGGRGLHQVIEITAGVSSVQDIRQQSGGQKLGPGSPVIAPTVALGYGFGYPITPRLDLVLLQEYGLMFFKRGDAPAGSNGSTPRTQVTRIGLRMGLGG